MENSKTYPIPLDSPLETNISHVLVPVTNPTFSFNPQSPVSGMLSNAIKYEGDGIFAGWYRYDINCKYTYRIDNTGIDSDGTYPLPGEFQIHPADIDRNFYSLEGERYAVSVAYPWTSKWRNLSFVCGFANNNIIPGGIGSLLSVIRTNYRSRGILPDGSEGPTTYSMTGVEPYASEGPDQYIISGRTHLKNLPVRLLADVYQRQLLRPNFDDEVNVNAPDFPSYIPFDYEEQLTWNKDTVFAEVNHVTRDQDNAVLTIPDILDWNCGNDLTVLEILSGARGVLQTQTLFNMSSTDVNRFISIDDNHAVTLGPSLRLKMLDAPHVANPGRPSEAVYVDVVNDLDPISEDLLVECGEAIISVRDRGSSDTYVLGTSDTLKRESLTSIEMALIGNINADGSGVLQDTPIESMAGRPYATVESGRWLGQSINQEVGFTIGLQATMTESVDGYIDETYKLDVHDTGLYAFTDIDRVATKSADRTIHDSEIAAKMEPLMSNMEAQYKTTTEGYDERTHKLSWFYVYHQDREAYRDYFNGHYHLQEIDYAGLSNNPNHRRKWGCAVLRVEILGRWVEVEDFQRIAEVFVAVRCNDVESGDWSAYPATIPGTSRYPTNSLEIKEVRMDQSLTNGFVSLTFPAANSAITTGIVAPSNTEQFEFGLTFSFTPVKVKYIKNITWKATRKDTHVLKLGETSIGARVSWTPWDFNDTLVRSDGISPSNAILPSPIPSPYDNEWSRVLVPDRYSFVPIPPTPPVPAHPTYEQLDYAEVPNPDDPQGPRPVQARPEWWDIPDPSSNQALFNGIEPPDFLQELWREQMEDMDPDLGTPPVWTNAQLDAWIDQNPDFAYSSYINDPGNQYAIDEWWRLRSYQWENDPDNYTIVNAWWDAEIQEWLHDPANDSLVRGYWEMTHGAGTEINYDDPALQQWAKTHIPHSDFEEWAIPIMQEDPEINQEFYDWVLFNALSPGYRNRLRVDVREEMDAEWREEQYNIWWNEEWDRRLLEYRTAQWPNVWWDNYWRNEVEDWVWTWRYIRYHDGYASTYWPNEYQKGEVDRWIQRTWPNVFAQHFAQEGDNGGIQHRQCIRVTYSGITSTEESTVRYVMGLPQLPSVESQLSVNNATERTWNSFSVLGEPIQEYVGYVFGTGEPFRIAGGFEDVILRYEVNDQGEVVFDEREPWEPSVEPSKDREGVFRISGIQDLTHRRITLRRGGIYSSSGLVTSAYCSIVQGIPSNLGIEIRFTDTQDLRQYFHYTDGSLEFSPENSSPELEMSRYSEYERYMRYSNGDFAQSESTDIEMALWVLYVATMQSDNPEDSEDVVWALNEVRHMVFSQRTPGAIGTFINTSVLRTWSSYYELITILNAYAPVVGYNVDTAGVSFRVTFRDADKVAFEFFPIGIFMKGSDIALSADPSSPTVPNIRYISHSTTWDGPRMRTVTSRFHNTDRQGNEHLDTAVVVHTSEYAERPPEEWETYGKWGQELGEGRAYIACEAHDLRTGEMSELTVANPDSDYAVVTHQFDADLSTENMYYLDEDHIMKCTSREFSVLRQGDEGWEVLTTLPRASYLNTSSEVIRYGVTCAEEVRPWFYIIEPNLTGIQVTLRPMVTSRGTDIFNWSISQSFRVSIPLVDLDTYGFSSTRFSFMQSPPSFTFFVTSVRISSTAVGSAVLLGLQYDKGIHQWTVTIDTNTHRHTVFNGYGCVGIDGTVTGGAVPMFAMNPLSGLSVQVGEKPEAGHYDTNREGKEFFVPGDSFNTSRRAYISGGSLVFLDPSFNGGICTSAKWSRGGYRLRALPLRFSRHQMDTTDGDSRISLQTSAVYVPPVNFGGVTMAIPWAWSTAIAGLSLNSWVVANLEEEEDFYLLDVKKESELESHSDTMFRVAAALVMGAATVANAAWDSFLNAKQGLNDEGKAHKLAQQEKEENARNAAQIMANAQAVSDLYGEEAGAAWRQQAANIQAGETSIEDLKTLVKMQRYEDVVLTSLNSALAANTNFSDKPKAVAIAKARIGCSSLYSISADQHVYAGPGFTQIHFSEGSRISGSYSNSHQANGRGVMILPKMPQIPLGPMGMLDLNNNNIVGVNPVDGPQTSEITLQYQPNFNVGTKHMVYSYPTQEMQAHNIKQTQLIPTNAVQDQLLFETDKSYVMGDLIAKGQTQKWYPKNLLKYKTLVTSDWHSENCSLVQGVDAYGENDEIQEVPIKVDAGYHTYAGAGTYDYCVYPQAELFYTATSGEVTGVSVRDTLVLDGLPSNVVIKNMKPLIASAYACIEVTDEVSNDTLKPRVYSGDSVILNVTGVNIVKGLQTLHGFDGYTNRISKLVGETGTDIEISNSVFSHINNGRIKTGSMFPGISYYGKFTSPPEICEYPHRVNVFSQYLRNLGQCTENLRGLRVAIPIVHKNLALLPAVVHTLAPYKAYVIDGVTSFTTDLRTTSSHNKTHEAYDFSIYEQPFRVNAEYISRLNAATGTIALQDVAATLGLRYLGATPKVAWFYSPVTNMFFTFTGSSTIDPAAVAFVFKDAETGTWDFVSQEVVFKTMMERDSGHSYKAIVRVNSKFAGMVYPPNETVTEGKDYDLVSGAGGLIIQGEKRGQVNRYVMHDYMFRQLPEEHSERDIPGYYRYEKFANDGIQVNHGNWTRIPGDYVEDFWKERSYDLDANPQFNKIYGWFLDPFKIATSFLGIDESMDCMFEWEIAFALTPMLKRLLGDRYVTVFLGAETQSVGGTVISEVTKLYLKTDMFQREQLQGRCPSDSSFASGYYSFRFNSRNGAGNSEKLYIWSDGGLFLRSLNVDIATLTTRRTAPLITQVDITGMEEL